MTLNVRYQTPTTDYTCPIMPEWTVSVSNSFDAAGARTTQEETWNLSGYLKADGTAAIKALKDALVAGFALDGGNVYLRDGSTVLHQLLAAQCTERSPHVISLEFPEPLAGAWATNLEYKIAVRGKKSAGTADPADPTIVELEYTDSWSTDQDNITTYSRRGKLTTTTGTSAAARVPNYAPVPPANSIRTNYDYSINQNDTEATFIWSYLELWHAFPVGVTSGAASTSESMADGVLTTTVSGRWTGPRALAAARSLRPRGRNVTHDEITQNPYAGEVSFSFAYTTPAAGRTELERTERVSISKNFHKIFHKPKRRGYADYMQETGNPDWTITVAGRAVSTSAYPTAPALMFAETACTSHEVESDYKRRADGTVGEYIVTWSQQFHISADPGQRRPRT